MNGNNNNNNNAYHTEARSTVLLNTFVIDKKRFRVFYNNGLLIWEKEKSKNTKTCIPVEDIISVETSRRTPSSPARGQQVFPILDANSPSLNSGDIPNEEFNHKSFTINYAKRLSSQQGSDSSSANKWRVHSITLFNNDRMIVKEWFDTLSKILNALSRPRKLLLFVNPYGGKQNALKLYEKYAKPIFKLANIDVTVMITQRPNQIFDLVLQQHLDPFDGIACCGGDGTFSELFNGLIYRDILREHSNDLTKLDLENIPRPSKPLGIIPAGSTDSIAFCLHGTSDVKTSVIHIVLGQSTGLDISSVSNDKGILKFYASVISYGYLGDVLYQSESLRWLGPRRYEFAGFKKILSNQGYDVELLLLQDSDSEVITNCDEKEKVKCLENCSTCSVKDSGLKVSEENEKYKRITGKVFMMNGANISCACSRSPAGMAPYSHIGDGYINVIMVRHGNLWKNLKLLLTLSSENGNIEKLPFVEVYRTRKFRMKALNSSSERSLADSTAPISITPNKNCSVWNCDGEIIPETEVTVRSHRQLITVYRRGATDQPPEDSSNCCLF